ncbi:MAG TPA: SIMPL domain-containing protein [Alphaproteobacteria bacterium]|nr:SIMPL domain-containing protein [Alphaproteobacteria bacterium]HNS45015.1 SIMPL domain-containing protein [Alphaproteobacteria bacterium]
MKYFLMFFCVLSMTPLVVQAQEARAVLETGQTLVTLNASDQKDVEQDLLVADLRIEIDDKDARTVQDRINKAMQQAVAVAKKVSEVEVSTGQYYVYSYDPNSTPRPVASVGQKPKLIWKGSQSLQIQSKDSQKILDLVAEIQDQGFAVNGLSYTLSNELAETYRDELMVGALKKIQSKAALIAKSLGKSGYDIIEVNVEGAYMPSPMPMLRGMAKAEMAMASDMAVSAPVAEPGKTTVNLSVSARVVIKP